MQQSRADLYTPDQALQDAIEKVNYAIENNSPVKIKHVLRIYPDMNFETMTSFDKINKSEAVL